MKLRLTLLGMLSAVAAGAATLTDLKVFPADVKLTTRGDRQAVVVQAIYDDGVTRDVTGEAALALADKKFAALQQAVLTPLSDGSTELRVKFKGRTVAVPVSVERSGMNEPISFTKDVMPVFTKAGCNTGGCHGASRGKDGFHLSLFGYDPQGDYHRITRELIGRRINLALPEESLLLEKATNKVPHTGGNSSSPTVNSTALCWRG